MQFDGGNGGNGSGAAGLGGAIFVRTGTLVVETVEFVDGTAIGGGSSVPDGAGNRQGKAAAIFVADGVDARFYRVGFRGNDASDATGQGIVSGEPDDSDDVHGVLIAPLLFEDAFE